VNVDRRELLRSRSRKEESKDEYDFHRAPRDNIRS
jgi:hypothetical protein